MNESAAAAAPVLANAYDPECCALCGRELPPRKSKRGRPRERHDECRQLESVLVRLERDVDSVDFDPQRASVLRSRLWAIANRLNYQGRPVKQR